MVAQIDPNRIDCCWKCAKTINADGQWLTIDFYVEIVHDTAIKLLQRRYKLKA